MGPQESIGARGLPVVQVLDPVPLPIFRIAKMPVCAPGRTMDGWVLAFASMTGVYA